MYKEVLPPDFRVDIGKLEIEDDLCESIPTYEEMCDIMNFIITTREKYCPVTNYDISGRSSRGILLGIPDSGFEAVSILRNKGICEVFICAYCSERRAALSRNCRHLGIESKVQVCRYTFFDSLDQWYPDHAVMTPVFLDLIQSRKALSLCINEGNSISILGKDLKSILSKCWTYRVPFVCLRINNKNLDFIRNYGMILRAFDVTPSSSPDVFQAIFCNLDILRCHCTTYPKFR